MNFNFLFREQTWREALRRFPNFLNGSLTKRAQLGTATDSLSPPERGEGWGEGI